MTTTVSKGGLTLKKSSNCNTYERALRRAMVHATHSKAKSNSATLKRNLKEIAEKTGLNKDDTAEVVNLALSFRDNIISQFAEQADKRYKDTDPIRRVGMANHYVNTLKWQIIFALEIMPEVVTKESLIADFLSNGCHISEATEIVDFVYDFMGYSVDYLNQAVRRHSDAQK